MFGVSAKAVTVTTVAMVLLTVLGVSAAAPVSAAPTSAAGSSYSEWAYGAWKNTSFGPVPWIGHPSWVRQGDLAIGFSSILNQTQSAANASTIELSVVRTMGVSFSVRYCTPSCASPSEYLDIYYLQWENTSSHANLTEQGTVVGPSGSAEPALAVLNSSTQLQANLTNTYDWLLPGTGMMSGKMVDHTAETYASVMSDSAVAFDPSLGLFPLNTASASNWTAHSAYNASGSTQASYFVHTMSSMGTAWMLGPATARWGVNASGDLWLNGSVMPGGTKSWGGLSYPVLDLHVSGPFSVREGFILVPDAADLFGTSSEAWSDNETGDTVASMASLDARASADGHLGVVASSWQFIPTSTNSMDSIAPTGGVTPALTSVTDPVGSGPYVLQGQPEPVSAAQSQSTCVTTGLGCVPSSTAAPLRKLLVGVVVAGVVATVVAALLVMLVAERRRLPPPAYPNAQLYPPGAATGPAPPKARSPRPGSSPEPSEEEDPLDHLW